jgi:hypothetical protein
MRGIPGLLAAVPRGIRHKIARHPLRIVSSRGMRGIHCAFLFRYPANSGPFWLALAEQELRENNLFLANFNIWKKFYPVLKEFAIQLNNKN